MQILPAASAGPDGKPALMPAPAVPSTAGRGFRWALGLFLLCLAANLASAVVGWNNTVLDFIGFRQSQTALSAQFMLGHRYRVVYETPVLGPPWEVPYEFPLYQWLVAGLATLTGWDVDPCGRLVSKVFFLLTLLPFHRILRRLGVAPASRLLILALFLASPFFAFWSRTVLIESTALFLAACYLDGVHPFRDRPGLGPLLYGLSLGVLAGLVKITTLAGFSLAATLALLPCLRRGTRRLRCGAVLLLAVPALSAIAWNRFADSVKEANPFGRSLTSRALAEWNFGPWSQRFDPKVWATLLERSWLAVPHPGFLFLGGGVVGAILLAAGCLAVASRSGRWGNPIRACLAAYVVPPLVFTNLYWFHEYYHFANHPFLLAAVGLSLAALLETGGRRRGAAAAAAACAFVLAPLIYHSYYYPIQATNEDRLLGACRAVRERTEPDDVILVLGWDWSSEVPYYCRRRGLALPDSWPGVSADRLAEYLEPLRPYRLRALVVQGRDYRDAYPAIDAALAGLGLRRTPAYADEAHEVFLLVPQSRPE
jgi:hypothetical protein